MATMKIKKGDTVKVIAGADKGTEGKVIAVNHKNNTVLVEGVNMITKHTKPSAQNQQGGIVHQEGPISASNVMFIRWMETRKSALLRQPVKLSTNI